MLHNRDHEIVSRDHDEISVTPCSWSRDQHWKNPSPAGMEYNNDVPSGVMDQASTLQTKLFLNGH